MLVYQGSPKSRHKTKKDEHKKANRKKVVNKKTLECEPRDYIMLGDDFYPAQTHSERK